MLTGQTELIPCCDVAFEMPRTGLVYHALMQIYHTPDAFAAMMIQTTYQVGVKLTVRIHSVIATLSLPYTGAAGCPVTMMS